MRSLRCSKTRPKKSTILALCLACSLLLLFCGSLFLSPSVSAVNNNTGSSAWNPRLNEKTISGTTTTEGYRFSQDGARNVCFSVLSANYSNQYYVFSFSMLGGFFTPTSHLSNSWGPVNNLVLDVSYSSSPESSIFDYSSSNQFGPGNLDFVNRTVYTISGRLNGSDSGNNVCFGNDNGSIRSTSPSGFYIITGGAFTYLPDEESLQTTYLQQIAQNTNGQTDAINNLKNQNHADAQAQKQSTDAQTQQQANQYHEQMEGMENAQTDANSGADDSGEAASQSGSTLLQAFTDFVSAITSASPSSCNINADIGDLKLGNVDLCELSPPASVQIISSILLIGFCVPLSIATARKMINLYRSFQN